MSSWRECDVFDRIKICCHSFTLNQYSFYFLSNYSRNIALHCPLCWPMADILHSTKNKEQSFSILHLSKNKLCSKAPLQSRSVVTPHDVCHRNLPSTYRVSLLTVVTLRKDTHTDGHSHNLAPLLAEWKKMEIKNMNISLLFHLANGWWLKRLMSPWLLFYGAWIV